MQGRIAGAEKGGAARYDKDAVGTHFVETHQVHIAAAKAINTTAAARAVSFAAIPRIKPMARRVSDAVAMAASAGTDQSGGAGRGRCVEVTSDSADQRARLVRLTPLGWSVVEAGLDAQDWVTGVAAGSSAARARVVPRIEPRMTSGKPMPMPTVSGSSSRVTPSRMATAGLM